MTRYFARSRWFPGAGMPAAIAAGMALISAMPMALAAAQTKYTDAESREHAAAMGAHHLCSGLFVVGRDYVRSPEAVLAEDVTRFPVFNWQDDFEYHVDADGRSASVWAPGIPTRVAQYNGDQGCTILPQGEGQVRFRPVAVPRRLPAADAQPWPTGDAGAHGALPPDADGGRFERALDWAMAQREHNTRALVVIRGSHIIGERYAPGFTRNTPQISWSQGKSITAALIGVLVQQGRLDIDDPAPIALWRGDGDPRHEITIRHLLRMSSGLDFHNLGLNLPNSWTNDNEHFRIYFDGLNVFDHAVDQPMDLPPDSLFRYRNSDPLTLGRIVRETVEASGEEYLTFPQRALFDRIGARNYVLETDVDGNFIMTGYDYGSAWDWARFGLLHLWNGEWEGDRILPEWWSEFVSTPAPADPNRGYGGLFWLNAGGALDRVPEDAYWASGFMGQTTMIIPSRDMVIVRLGPSPSGFNSYLNEFVGEIVNSVR